MNLLLAEVAQATQRLADAGVPSPRTDAEELAAFVHGVKRGELHSVKDADFDARYWEVIARREQREPLQHITGRAYFRYLELQVGPGVFVPRPETESVVGWAIDAVRAMDVVEPCVVDLCTGSGAIALALAQEVPRSRVHAVELSEDALRWTRKNVEGSRVDLRQGDALSAFPDLDGQVDLVISNPPYIPLTEWEYVAPEARDYDPELALFSGEDGLDLIRGIERTAHRLLRPAGWSSSSTPTPRADRCRGSSPRSGAGPTRPITPTSTTGRGSPPPARRCRDRRRDFNPAVCVRGGPLDGTAIRHQRRDRPRDGSARSRVRRPPGELVVLPTDTVYGIGADAFSSEAVADLLAAKGRGRNMPTPVLIGSPNTLHGLVTNFSEMAWELVDAFWPGALTLVAKHQPSLQWDLGDTRGTVAVRMPLHPVAIELLTEVGPMAVSSANLTGHPSPETCDAAQDMLGDSVSVYLDGGPTPGIVPSSIVDVSRDVPVLLREGAISADELRKVVPDLEVAN